jgi:nitrate reductase gamma subunit
MSSYANFVLFGVYPYVALAILAIGSIIRYDREPYTWRSGSSQLLRRRQLVWGSVLFHVGVLAIFAGHLVGLLTPIWIFDAIGISHGAKQLLAVGLGGIAGVMALIGGALLIHRRLFDSRIRRTSSVTDILILLLLYAQLILGMISIRASLGHLDGEEMLRFMGWAQGIFTFRPESASLIADTAPIFKAHILLGLTIFVLFPFTRLVHMLSVPLRYLWRPGYQIVRARKRRAAPRMG